MNLEEFEFSEADLEKLEQVSKEESGGEITEPPPEEVPELGNEEIQLADLED